MSAYLDVADHLFEHGSITAAEAADKFGLPGPQFRHAIIDLRKVIQIKSELIETSRHGKPMNRHTLVREPRPCISQ